MYGGSGTLDASGKNAGEKGGTIEVLGDHVGILAGSVIDASGDAGGGTVRVGGDYHGEGTTPTALATIVQSDTIIKADALNTGDGGNVTVWADDYTNYAGTITARGGVLFGNGGFVETSGKQVLDMHGNVDASASYGVGGTWLLDPNNAIINAVATSNPAYSTSWTAGAGGGNVLYSDIETSLNAGTNVTITASGSIEVAHNIAKTAGADATLDLEAGTDITVDAGVSISSNTNKLNVIFDADTAAGGGAIFMDSGSSITSNGGNISMYGQSDSTKAAVGDVTYINGIYLLGASVNAGAGNISMIGTGYGAGAGSNAGVLIAGDPWTRATTVSTTSGNITLTGTGGTGTAGLNVGVHMTAVAANSTITTADGAISITGTGGASTGDNNYGIGINQGGCCGGTSTVSATGTGSISLTGTGGGSGGSAGNQGVSTDSGTISVVSGNLDITGTGGAGNGNGNNGVFLYNNTTSTVSGDITITGTGGSGTGNNNRGFEQDYGTLETTGTGGIAITGTGGSSGAGGFNHEGILLIYGPGTLRSTAVGGGSITLNGTGATTTDWNSAGVDINGGFVISSMDGNIAITGTGGDSDGFSAGVGISAGGQVQSSGNATIAITGTTLTTAAGQGNNAGIDINGVNSLITSAIGDITLNGTGGDRSRGVQIYNSAIVETTGAADISITGQGGGGAGNPDDFAGMYIGSIVRSTAASGGSIALNGTGGDGITFWNGDYGIQITGASASVTSKDGAINITGTGGGAPGHDNNYGIDINTGATVGSTGNAAITLTGVKGVGANSYGIYTDASANALGGGSDTGAITLVTDTISLGAGTTAQTSGNVWFKPYTANTTVGVAGAAGTLQVTSAILDMVTANTIIVGRSDGTGALTANAYGWSNSATFLTGSGQMTVNGAQTLGAHNLTLQTDSDLAVNANLSGTGTLTIKPSAAGTTMELGGTGQTLNLSTTELDKLVAGWSSLNFGASGDSGLMKVDNYNWADNVNFINGSGEIRFTGGTSTLSNNKYLTATTTSGDITAPTAGGGIVTSGTGYITLTSGHDINFSQDFDLTSSTGAVLVKAKNDILYSGAGDITTSGGAITLNSDSDASGAGAVSIGAGPFGAGTAITSNGGDITFGGGVNPLTDYAYGDAGYKEGVHIYTGNETINAGAGTITIHGHGYNDNTNTIAYIYGVKFDADYGGFITTSGNITANGVGGTGGLYGNNGISIDYSKFTTADGTITFNGSSGVTAGGYDKGIEAVSAAYAPITATGTGSIIITGTSNGTVNTNNASDGVYLGNQQVLSNSGTITITGIMSGGSTGPALVTDTATIGNGSTTGAITLIGDSASFATTTVTTTGNVTIKPYSQNGTIKVAGAATGNLDVSTAVLGSITAANTIIGRSDGTGLMRVAGADLSGDPFGNLSLLNGSANIQFDGGGTAMKLASNKSFTETATSGGFTTSANGTITTSGTGNVTFNNAVTLGGNLALNTGSGTLTFGNTVNGGYNLTATSGTFSFAAALGATTPLGAVSLISTNGLTLPSITATSIVAQTTGATSDITLPVGKILTASGSNTAITLASGRNFINNAGAGVLSAPSGRWLVYSTNPASDTLGGLSSDFRRFSCIYGGSCPSFPGTGNGYFYSYTPTLTATPSGGISLIYGAAAPNLTGYAYGLAGYLGSDSGSDSITGSLNGTTAYTSTSPVGSYNISQSSGSLASAMGYGFSYANNNSGITVGAKALAVTATAGQKKTSGAADPGSYTYTYTGLVNGDPSATFAGALVRDAGENAGTYAINQGSLAATGNYSIGTYSSALFTINAAALPPAPTPTPTPTREAPTATVDRSEFARTLKTIHVCDGLQDHSCLPADHFIGAKDSNATDGSTSDSTNVGTYRIAAVDFYVPDDAITTATATDPATYNSLAGITNVGTYRISSYDVYVPGDGFTTAYVTAPVDDSIKTNPAPVILKNDQGKRLDMPVEQNVRNKEQSLDYKRNL